MGRNTSISLGDRFESFVESTVSNGRFNNASEVVPAGLRLLEEEENRIPSLGDPYYLIRGGKEELLLN